LEADVRIELRVHIRSVISYAVISAIFLLLQPFLFPPYGIIINPVIMAATIGCMIIFNAARLHYFLANKLPN
jgi:hypothetical protein